MSSPIRWNMFARELEDILLQRKISLGMLDDRAKIHPETVRRLQRSLPIPKHFPTLNPNDLATVIRVFQLTRDDTLRLRAAVLATAVEKMLMDRIAPAEALRAAEYVYDVALQSLRAGNDLLSGVRGVRDQGDTMDDETELDVVLESALECIDRATLALHLSRGAATTIERIDRAREAVAAFGDAVAALRALPQSVQITDAWQHWHAEAERGLTVTRIHLADLGAD